MHHREPWALVILKGSPYSGKIIHFPPIRGNPLIYFRGFFPPWLVAVGAVPQDRGWQAGIATATRGLAGLYYTTRRLAGWHYLTTAAAPP